MQNIRNIALWGVALALVVALYGALGSSQPGMAGNQSKIKAVEYSRFIADVREGQIASAVVQGERVRGQYKNGDSYSVVVGDSLDLPRQLTDAGVRTAVRARDEGGLWAIILSWVPGLLLVGLWFFFMRQMNGGAGKAMGFGKSRAKLLNENKNNKITFADVAGIDEAREELTEIVEFLRDPQKFRRLGGRIPKGALLVGPPGTGKTLLAKAIAGEAGVPFFSISGSDFVEMFVGVGASRVRDMFEQAKKNAPCIVFIDEIDAVGRQRGSGFGNVNTEHEQTLNQLLVEMDGFESNEGIILVAATNRPDVLDPALLRPGRFDRQINVPNPDIKGREAILNVHIRRIAVDSKVDARTLARGTPGFSGAELANLVNEAALLAARRDKKFVSMQEFEDAKDKVMMGSERRSLAMTDEEKKLTAYHEAGHALIGKLVPGNNPVHKITIIPRGRALGVTVSLPERDAVSINKREMKARLAMLYGGRVAEELIFGADYVTTGASNDILQATETARAMVTIYGMSDVLGPIRYRNRENESPFSSSMADDTQRVIDAEVRKLIEEAEATARKVLSEHAADLEALALALLEHETVSGEDMEDILAGRPISRDTDAGSDDAQAQYPLDVPPLIPNV